MNKFKLYEPIKDLIVNDYVLLDLPYHVNTGDLLIWQGELSFLKHEVKSRMLGYYNQATFGFPKLQKDTVILLHGGGNFGDVWRMSQDFRLKVLRKYPNNRIVIFPQSVCYSTEELAISDAEQFAKHHDVTICARDEVSFEYLKRFFSNTLLCIPDMAFCIDNDIMMPNILAQTKDNLYFKRTDHEFREVIVDFIEGEYDTCDWPGTANLSRFIKNLYMIMILIQRLREKRGLYQWFANALSWCVNIIFMYIVRPQYIRSGVRLMSRYRNIYTTRLHGLILAHLLGKEIFIVSNNNGKLENYYNSWLKNCKNIRIVNC